jgi:hypothetical protein
MKISSQLTNNFDYCSAEFGVFFNKDSLLRALRASALKVVADPSQPKNWLIRPLADFGGSAVNYPKPKR